MSMLTSMAEYTPAQTSSGRGLEGRKVMFV